ncbi:hypothetical protein KCU99_g124, partial [Aureobasidium melanogenum]
MRVDCATVCTEAEMMTRDFGVWREKVTIAEVPASRSCLQQPQLSNCRTASIHQASIFILVQTCIRIGPSSVAVFGAALHSMGHCRFCLWRTLGERASYVALDRQSIREAVQHLRSVIKPIVAVVMHPIFNRQGRPDSSYPVYWNTA